MLGIEDDTEPTPEHCDGLVTVQEAKGQKKSVQSAGRTHKETQMLTHISLPPLKLPLTTPYTPGLRKSNRAYKGTKNNLTPRRMPRQVLMPPRGVEGMIDLHKQMKIVKRLPTQEDILSGTARALPDPVFNGPEDEYRMLGRSLLNQVNEPSAFDHFDRRFGQPSELCAGGCPSELLTPEELFDSTPTHAFNASPIHANWGTPRHYFDGCLVDRTNSNEYRQHLNRYMSYSGKQ